MLDDIDGVDDEIHEVIAWFLKFLVVKFLLGED